MVDFSKRDEVQRWLERQPREVAVVLAARAALRVLPLIRDDNHPRDGDDWKHDVVLPVFRGLVVPWAAAKFPAQGVEIGWAFLAIGNAGAAAKAAAAEAVEAEVSDVSPAASVASAASASAYAAWAAAGSASASSSAAAISAAAAAISAAATATAFATAAAAADDAVEIKSGASPTDLAGRVLWPAGVPSEIKAAWAAMKRGLLTAGDDWDVWTDWYDARLAGKRPWRKSIEIARVSLPEEFWQQGPAAVNAEIKRLIEAEKAKSRKHKRVTRGGMPDLEPLSVTSPIGFRWQGNVIGVANGVLPVVGPRKDPRDLELKLQACREIAKDLAKKIEKGRFNCRPEYGEYLRSYEKWLPPREEGNIYLADRAARSIRDLAEEERDFLTAPFLVDVKAFLEHHIGVRVHYPGLFEFFESIKNSELPEPFPLRALQKVQEVIEEGTPDHFSPSVGLALSGDALEPKEATAVQAEPAQPASKIQLPPDPVQEINLEREQASVWARAVNALLKTIKSGPEVEKNAESWIRIGIKLSESAKEIIAWLSKGN